MLDAVELQPDLEADCRRDLCSPYPFFRNASSVDGVLDFRNTTVPSDPSFALLSNASFVLFDHARGQALLGSNPSYDFVFRVRLLSQLQDE